jgi:hypothetical protein
VSHPSLGLPPRDLTVGHPAAAARLHADRHALGAAGLEIALQRTTGMRERYDEHGLRQLLRDTEVLIERIATAVASDDPRVVADFADQVAPIYRRRRVPMDDIVALLEGIRSATAGVLRDDEQVAVDEAIDAGRMVLRDYRRIAGDARKKNALLDAIYKGA